MFFFQSPQSVVIVLPHFYLWETDIYIWIPNLSLGLRNVLVFICSPRCADQRECFPKSRCGEPKCYLGTRHPSSDNNWVIFIYIWRTVCKDDQNCVFLTILAYQVANRTVEKVLDLISVFSKSTDLCPKRLNHHRTILIGSKIADCATLGKGLVEPIIVLV